MVAIRYTRPKNTFRLFSIAELGALKSFLESVCLLKDKGLRNIDIGPLFFEDLLDAGCGKTQIETALKIIEQYQKAVSKNPKAPKYVSSNPYVDGPFSLVPTEFPSAVYVENNEKKAIYNMLTLDANYLLNELDLFLSKPTRSKIKNKKLKIEISKSGLLFIDSKTNARKNFVIEGKRLQYITFLHERNFLLCGQLSELVDQKPKAVSSGISGINTRWKQEGGLFDLIIDGYQLNPNYSFSLRLS